MTEMQTRRKKKNLLPLLLLLCLSCLVGVTGATVLHKLTMENPLKTSTVEGSVKEKLDNGGKAVSFRNTGEADVFLRVAYTQTWTCQDGDDTVILPNRAEKTDGTMVDAAEPVFVNGSCWTEGDDGWNYYNQVLPGTASGKGADDRTSKLFVDGVTFADFKTLKDTRYQNASYSLHFTMEVVQASSEKAVSEAAAEELFGKTPVLPTNWPGEDKYAAFTWPKA